jgi:hypothetical protein
MLCEVQGEKESSEMTVKELRDFLADKPDDLIIVMSCDAEGNGYSPLRIADSTNYVPDTAYFGEIYDDPIEAEGQGEVCPCIGLWPTN